MISPNTFKNEAYKVSELFEELELNLLKKINVQLTKNTNLSPQDWKIQKLIDLEKFTNNREEIIKEATKISAELGEVLENSFKKGIVESDTTAQELKALGSSPNKVSTQTMFFQTDIGQISALNQEMNRNIVNTVLATYTDASIKYREAVFRSTGGVLSGSMTLNESINQSVQELAKKGIGNVILAGDRQMNVTSYMEMATRTACTKASLIATASRNKEYGYELCQVSEYAGSSPTCSPWQGLVYFDDTLGDLNNTDYPSLSEAINNGLFHPNCRHHKFPFDPEVQDYKPQLEADKELYQKEQEQRYNERMIRSWKKREAVANTPNDILKTKNKVSEWQQKNRELIKLEPRLRREYIREQLRD